MEGGWGNTAKVKLGTMFFFFFFCGEFEDESSWRWAGCRKIKMAVKRDSGSVTRRCEFNLPECFLRDTN